MTASGAGTGATPSAKAAHVDSMPAEPVGTGGRRWPTASGAHAPWGLVFALVATAAAGCLEEPPPVHIDWEVRNESGQPIAYTLILEGGRIPHWINGTAQPGQVQHHEVIVNGVDLMATARLRDDARASGGVPFAVDGLCSQYLVTAAWDGETWDVDAAATECQAAG